MLTKTTKTIVAALVLATASVTMVANSYAASHPQLPPDSERAWMDRASQPFTGESGGQ